VVLVPFASQSYLPDANYNK